jgi:GxxExxY protein
MKNPIFNLCDLVRETAYAIHRYHRHGHLEKVYENALVHRLRKIGLNVAQQYPVRVCDEDGTTLGDYYADLLVENVLIVEVKAARALVPEHQAQVLGYLRSSGYEHALLLNFGAPHFEIQKLVLSQLDPQPSPQTRIQECNPREIPAVISVAQTFASFVPFCGQPIL